ncbi:DMT family transporter [Clostridium swellfunianum]|uniref:DMT family transporter n=1 Tax=Clostridium swellfunianum TaxID=1367462 RepID=UPI002030A56F|nr:DMT family transporter [Clostridium swellfunianum]MCM0647878.1 DMT family transporter [Clostridium swellfunianum]
MKKKHNMLPVLSGIGAATIFGLSFLFSKMALNSAGIFELLSFRFLIAFLIMSSLIVLKLIKVDYTGKNLKGLFLLGLMEPIIYFIFETYGIKYSSSSIAGLMIALIPIGVVILSAYFLKEKPSAVQLIFIIMSVLGVALIGVMGSSSSTGGNLFGIILLLGAVMSAAFFTIISRKLSSDFTPMELTYSMMFLGAVFFNAISIINHISTGSLLSYFAPLKNANFLISIGYLGILSSIVAYFLINFTLSKLEASKSAVVSNLATIVSIIAGVVILKEPFYYYHIVGSILIIVGVWGTNNYEIKRVVDTTTHEA